ncbi:MAG: hypothetical protein AB7G35_12750, partial [Hyphomicrobiaceae bacterium]
AFVVSLALLQVYRRAVRRSMSHASDTPARPPDPASAVMPDPAAPPRQPSPPLRMAPAKVPDAAHIRAAWSGPLKSAAVQLFAGLLYALTMTLIWASLAGGNLTWQGTALFTLMFAWPIVITVGLVATVTWRAMTIIVAIYALAFLAAIVWLTPGTGVTLPQVARNWWNMNGMATLLVLAFLARPIRAMGPIVVALMMAAVAGVFAMADLMGDQTVVEWIAQIATSLGFSGKLGGIAAGLIVLGLAALMAMIIAYAVLRGIGRLYQRRWFSDQSIQIDAVWLIFALAQAPYQKPLTGLAPFAVYKLVSWLALHLARATEVPDDKSPSLLLLRVFSLGPRSESLFGAFSLLWRHTGSVRMIAGPDLANSTVEPHEFLDFLAGRLQRRFITGPDVLDRRLAETEPRRDPDGRFRVAAFFCHADTWQMALRRLARDADIVLMDLRGFTPMNKGCIYELNELLDAVPLERIELVVDGTTDNGFLTEILQTGWADLSADSPNRARTAPSVSLFRLGGDGAPAVGKLVATLNI